MSVNAIGSVALTALCWRNDLDRDKTCFGFLQDSFANRGDLSCDVNPSIRVKDDEKDGSATEALFARDALIGRDHHIKVLFFGKLEQSTICSLVPTHFTGGEDHVSRKVLSKTDGHVLVEEDLQDAISTLMRMMYRITAFTCSSGREN